MARSKKPTNETSDESTIRRQLETVANSANRSEKVSWERKMDNMMACINKLTPIEDQILDLMPSKMPIIDQISEIRSDMVIQCVHPIEQLSHNKDHIECKFCNRKFSV